ncbi:WcbI family polysaccharide biosynthesis putative acetyltransferase [Acinetobacter sp. VNH17]|uniref:WcbI family polysaccharide biosynthesis putative acetyltransferase n=1 Tax=Acinetobacter thutiue TaxID=2998078 RepID=A0ABT7WS98_9GAMM|nr:WcbI family polysaccharide biosynthesis putative acetyltransferase [Acinetobacter thutiue]MCY6413452.1 WcbI family polysaccharide biosynthesis putative acetyltransferase [Acinetobacter thutiue]MDN0015561.1 WcbI family polysaccharide biosynthesis putative acetyltransferase [Acinetobacter thutiue]
MEKLKVFIFANCHGSIYQKTIETSDVVGLFEINHVVSYENLNNYDAIECFFRECDILIIQPVHNYEKFKVENIKKILKPECLMIRIPFIRFDGFWEVGDVRSLEKFKSAAVMFYPKIDKVLEIPKYLKGENLHDVIIQNNFDHALEKFRDLENTGDIKFVDFFLKFYQKIPLFRDSYHLTIPFFNFICYQIIEIIRFNFPRVKLKNQDINMNNIKISKEWGHYKPITNKVANVLRLEYDLSSYFRYNRYDYLARIIQYENGSNSEIIGSLNELNLIFDNPKVLI